MLFWNTNHSSLGTGALAHRSIFVPHIPNLYERQVVLPYIMIFEGGRIIEIMVVGTEQYTTSLAEKIPLPPPLSFFETSCSVESFMLELFHSISLGAIPVVTCWS